MESNHPAINRQPLKVTIVCHSDMLGGASVVSYRLMNALKYAGVQARMLVYTKRSDDPDVEVVSKRGVRGFKFMVERLRIALSNGFSRKNLFKVSLANVGIALYKHPWIAECDVVVLSWINQGLLSLKGIEQIGMLGKPIVWIMHDMWSITGICHHAYECDAYKRECGCCRFLFGQNRNDLSHKVWKRKLAIYKRIPMTFIAVSNWLADCCKESSLLGHQDVRVIPNAFPVESFSTTPTQRLTSIDINLEKNLILMGAARLDDPIKGLSYAIEALNYLFDNHPDIARHSFAVFFGDVRDKSSFGQLRFPHILLGRVNDTKMLRQIYASAKVVLSTSLYETLPGTLIEGQAAGCLPVTFGRGGQADIVEHKVNGYIAEYKNPRSVADGIVWALKEPVDRDALHESVRRRFSSSAVAQKYIELFESKLQQD